MYAPATSPPISTISQLRCRAGMVSASRANAIGSIPPTAAPMRKHMSRFQPNPGIAPQMDVAMNMTPASRIDARRPMRSPSQPHPRSRAPCR